ncbi:MAG: hypothetical protein DRH08_01690 [Deltaproteobacteria bacterium]|nr:MAG: hypothetical protein DRH08_01690 [Deltaproteobacteria bacterium]
MKSVAQTNGLLLNETWAQFLAEYKFLVGLSLDGPEHIHNRYRRSYSGEGTWATVSDKVKLLQDAGVAVNALSVVNSYSACFPEEIYVYLKQTGIKVGRNDPCPCGSNKKFKKCCGSSTLH